MSYKGTVASGVIVLDAKAKLPDGTKVEVRPVRQPARTSVRSRRERLARIDAIAAAMPPLPADFAAEHDHYIHGIPKRSSRG
ncbi:MAG: hypothetical protein EBS05_01750 [Proteobacteria bacterium]|jgi:hypothetical protein|nr:hypothetical protein [Pseudomonadota bacterium]